MAQGRLVLAVAILSACLIGAQAGYSNIIQVLQGDKQYSSYLKAVQAVGLDKDAVFSAGNWLATAYVPTNAAFDKMLKAEGKTLAKWLAGDKNHILAVVLQHVVPEYVMRSYDNLYDGQIKSSLYTLINHRSKIVVSTKGGAIVFKAEKSSGKLLKNAIVQAGKSRVCAIDSVLIPDDKSPAAKVPATFDNIYDLIKYVPGLEDFYAVVNKCSPATIALLKNPTKAQTVWLPNAYAMVSLTKIFGKTADQIMNDKSLVGKLEAIVKYHITPGYYAKKDFVTKEYFTTALAGHKLQLDINTHHNHIFIRSDRTATTDVFPKGKLMPEYPRKLATYMAKVPSGNLDALAGKHIGHVSDAWLVPKGLL